MNTHSLSAPWSRVAAFGLALCFAGVLLTSAHAATAADEPRQQVVSYGDLNLARPEGVKALYNRVHSAAVRVCDDDSRLLSRKVSARACVEQAMDHAIESINAPALTSYYAARKSEERRHS